MATVYPYSSYYGGYGGGIYYGRKLLQDEDATSQEARAVRVYGLGPRRRSDFAKGYVIQGELI